MDICDNENDKLSKQILFTKMTTSHITVAIHTLFVFGQIISPIIRPHRSITYVDAAYCHGLGSVVCRSGTLVSPAKTAEPIEMPFEFRNLWWAQGTMY